MARELPSCTLEFRSLLGPGIGAGIEGSVRLERFDMSFDGGLLPVDVAESRLVSLSDELVPPDTLRCSGTGMSC